jgi:SAM-dependent methyltransferase
VAAEKVIMKHQQHLLRGRFNAWLLRVLDSYMDGKYGALKRRLFADLPETVVELGAGSGANCRYLPRGTLLIAIEPNEHMHPHLRAAAARHQLALELRPVGADFLPLGDASAEVVICTLVLCTVSDPVAVLREVRRVLRPGGRFICVEHVAARAGLIAWVQRLLRRPWHWLFEGCHTDRDTERLLGEAGFREVSCEAITLRTAFVPIRPQIAAICTRCPDRRLGLVQSRHAPPVTPHEKEPMPMSLSSTSRAAITLFCGLSLAACQPGRHSGAAPATDVAPASVASSQVVLDWSEAAYQALVEKDHYANPLAASRVLAMMHIAQHDAVVAIVPRYAPYRLQRREPAADAVVAAAIAAHDVLIAELPEQQALVDRALATSLRGASPADSDAHVRGLAVGRAAAEAILADRRDDGSAAALAKGYQPASAGAGVYQFVAPLAMVAAPGWGHVRPFALQSPQQLRVAPPPALGSDAYAAAFEEVKAFGGKASRGRTADQSAYGKFWWEFSEIGWNRIARTATAARKVDLVEAVHLFALLNMALADGYIAGWDSKQQYDFWRPTTAIRAADDDGNPTTAPDPDWESAEVTPPAQDYPSTHSALGRAAAEVLTALLGDDVGFTFASTTADAASPSRSFASFREAANENADSRVRAGLHFRFSCDAGQQLGARIAEVVLREKLLRL